MFGTPRLVVSSITTAVIVEIVEPSGGIVVGLAMQLCIILAISFSFLIKRDYQTDFVDAVYLSN